MKYKMTLYSCYAGIFTQAITNNLAPLLFVVFRERFGLSFEMVGRLILINFATQIFVDLIAIKFADKIGHRLSLVLSQACSAIGLVLLGLSPLLFEKPYVGLVASVIIYAIGGGLTEVLVSPIVEGLPTKNKKTAMAVLHSFYCWGQVIVVAGSTLLLWGVGQDYWFVLPFMWASVPFVTIFLMAKMPLLPPLTDEERTPMKQLLKSKIFVILLVLMLASGASEISMSQWSSLFAQTGLGISKVMGDLLGPCLFAVLMGLGRLGYAVFGKNIDVRKYLIFCSVLCIGCYLTASLVQIPIAALLGCAICGFSISMMWPGVLVYGAERFPKGGTAAFGACALFGDLGCSVGPWMAGLIADAATQNDKIAEIGAQYGMNAEQTGLKTGLLCAVIFPVILLLGLLLLKKLSPKSDKR